MPEFSWACTCGKGMASWSPDPDFARREADLHLCRAGRLREAHVVRVVGRGAEA